ncbi:hypothetical protein Anas_09542 [Armadillidium nasatum]|uniref:Uncharacterized protein n=1 Tax=Armadillidium nasatum TaxID=96803 RepID=A0A5N5SJU3_9CRUS|nr:hypothetical protein Anas_09542 [Armadillidium nasatum]
MVHIKCKLYHNRNLRKQFLFYGKRTTSKFIVIRKGPKHLTTSYCALKLRTTLTVTPGEGPSFFQNFHQSIYVFLRIYGCFLNIYKGINIYKGLYKIFKGFK